MLSKYESMLAVISMLRNV